MKQIFSLRVLCVIVWSSLAACGGDVGSSSSSSGTSGSSAVQINSLADMPTYPNAKALQPGQNPMADTLAKNVQQAGQVGAKLDQKIFELPKDAKWDDIKKFYHDKLTAASWQNLNLPMPDTEMVKMSVWKRGTQNMTVAQLTEPIKKDTFLLFSLSSQ